VLKKTEIARFNEHRTARLAIAAYDHVLPNDRAGEPPGFVVRMEAQKAGVVNRAVPIVAIDFETGRAEAASC
jgi:hypothetical protein